MSRIKESVVNDMETYYSFEKHFELSNLSKVQSIIIQLTYLLVELVKDCKIKDVHSNKSNNICNDKFINKKRSRYLNKENPHDEYTKEENLSIGKHKFKRIDTITISSISKIFY